MQKVTFGYWKVRDLGQHLRLLLSYTGMDFQQIQYDNKEKWFKEDKDNLGFDFPNLPYLIDGDFKLTESAAIAKYIIQRSGKTQLRGKNSQDHGKIENIIGVFNDAMGPIKALFWNKDYETLKIQLLEKARPKLNLLKEFVGEKPFALGYLTLVDFIIAQNLAYFQSLYLSQKNNFSFWWRIRHNFQELPEIKAYYKRLDAVHGPYLNQQAALDPKGLNLQVALNPKKVKLAYWGIRGLAQPCRHLLAYFKVPFEDYYYLEGDKWFKEDKLHLGLDFPNLPYLIYGEYNLSESTAIQKYIIHKWGSPQLLGKTVQDNAQVDSFLSVFFEISAAIKGLFFIKEHEQAKGPLFEKHKEKLDLLNKFVGEKEFAMGYLTLIDFVVSEDSNYIERVYPEESKSFPFLKRIRENFNNLPQIINYYKNENAFKGKFYPPYAFISVEKD